MSEAYPTINGHAVQAGERINLTLPLTELVNHAPVNVPVRVAAGLRPGPVLLVLAAIHGDEVVGMEIIRRLFLTRGLGKLRGTLVAVPCANPLGFIAQSRYLPDRRDLNRHFPGSKGGSLASQVAHALTKDLLRRATHIIDLHSGAIHRRNLPQIRTDLRDPVNAEMAEAFAAPFILDNKPPPGSLRRESAKRRIPTIVYEAGEALRIDEFDVKAGLRGIQRVMRKLGMLPRGDARRRQPSSLVASKNQWVRAPQSGLMRLTCRLGQVVGKGDVLGIVGDLAATNEVAIRAPISGVIIGLTAQPAVLAGEAVLHLARAGGEAAAAGAVAEFLEWMGPGYATVPTQNAPQEPEPTTDTST